MASDAINWKKNALILGFVEFCVRSMMMLVRPYIPLYLPELGVMPSEIAYWTGLLTSVNFIALAITTPFWGRLADKVGRKPMVLRCVLFMGIFNIFLAMATTAFQFLVIRFVMGAISGVNAAATTMVATSTPEKNLGYAIGMIQTGYMAGTLMGPVIGSVLADVVGYRGCLVVAGITILLLLPMVIFGVKENFVKPPAQEKTERNPLGNKLAEMRGSPQWKAISVFILLLCLSQLALQGNDSFVTLQVKGIYDGTRLNLIVAVTFGVLAAANVLTAPFMGKLGDRLGPVRVLITCLLLFAVCMGLQVIANVRALILLRTAEGILIAGILPNAYTCITKLTNVESRGSVLGITASMVALGSFLGPNVGGLVGTCFGIPAIFLVLGGLLGMFGLAALIIIKKLDIS